MSTDISFEETWEKMDKELVTAEELEKGLEKYPSLKKEVQRIKEDNVRTNQFHMKPVEKGKKPHHKYPSNYTPPKRRLRKKK